MEAAYGKNPMYHTGKVLSHLASRLAKEIFSRFGVKCSVLAMCKNGQSLIPPAVLSISLEREINRETLSQLIADYFERDYVSETIAEWSVV